MRAIFYMFNCMWLKKQNICHFAGNIATFRQLGIIQFGRSSLHPYIIIFIIL